jgi:hypothetical protein
LIVLVLVVHFHFPSAFVYSLQYSLVQHALCLKTRNIEETNQCRSVSPWLWLSLLVLLAAPGRGCIAAAPRDFSLSMPVFGTSMFPCPRVCAAGNAGTCAGQV